MAKQGPKNTQFVATAQVGVIHFGDSLNKARWMEDAKKTHVVKDHGDWAELLPLPKPTA